MTRTTQAQWPLKPAPGWSTSILKVEVSITTILWLVNRDGTSPTGWVPPRSQGMQIRVYRYRTFHSDVKIKLTQCNSKLLQLQREFSLAIGFTGALFTQTPDLGSSRLIRGRIEWTGKGHEKGRLRRIRGLTEGWGDLQDGCTGSCNCFRKGVCLIGGKDCEPCHT
jgi:hypothetical protein